MHGEHQDRGLNASTALKDDAVKAAVAVLQTQVHRDFAPAWGVDADLTFVPKQVKPASGTWWLTVLVIPIKPARWAITT